MVVLLLLLSQDKINAGIFYPFSYAGTQK